MNTYIYACVLMIVLSASSVSHAANLRDAEKAFLDGDYDKSRKIYEKILKRAQGGEEQSARLGIAWTYMYEKDYSAAVSALAQLNGRYPNNTRGDWMRLLMYTAGRALAAGTSNAPSADAGARNRVLGMYHSLVRYPPGFSLDNLELWLDLNRKLKFFERPSMDDESAPADRLERYRTVETLAGLDIHDAAIRMLRMLTVEKNLDQVSRASLFLQGRESVRLGDVDAAKEMLTVFVFLFPKDPKAAMALSELARLADRLGAADDSRRYRAALADHFSESLHGVEAGMVLAWRSNDPRWTGSVIGSVNRLPGLPPSLAERGLALAVSGSASQLGEAERYEAVDRYAKAFPLSPHAADARRWVDGHRPPEPVKVRPSGGASRPVAPSATTSIERPAKEQKPGRAERGDKSVKRPWWKVGGGGVWKPDHPASAEATAGKPAEAVVKSEPVADTHPVKDTAPPTPPKPAPEPLKPTPDVAPTVVADTVASASVSSNAKAGKKAGKSAAKPKKSKMIKPILKQGVWFRSSAKSSEESDSKPPAPLPPDDSEPLKRNPDGDTVKP